MTMGKTIALTRQTFVGKVMSLLFNMLSRLVITFLPRSKSPLISWLQSPSAVILEPQDSLEPSTSAKSYPLPTARAEQPLLVQTTRKGLKEADVQDDACLSHGVLPPPLEADVQDDACLSHGVLPPPLIAS